MTTIDRPTNTTFYLAELNQRLHRRLQARAWTTNHRGLARPSRPRHQTSTTDALHP